MHLLTRSVRPTRVCATNQSKARLKRSQTFNPTSVANQSFGNVKRSGNRGYATSAYNPTDLHSGNPGHIGLLLSMEDVKNINAFLPKLLQIPEGAAQFSHAPVTGKRGDRMQIETDRTNKQYENWQLDSAPATAPYSLWGAQTRTHDIGTLRGTTAQIIANQIIRQHPKYSLGGEEKPVIEENWTPEERASFKETGEVPMNAPNCVNPMKIIYREMAKILCKANPEALGDFLRLLNRETTPQGVGELVKKSFTAMDGGVAFSFKSEQL